MRAFGLVVDDCVHGHMGPNGKAGEQYIQVGNTKYPMYFDGWKRYFQIQKPTSADLVNYPIIKLTSSTICEPQCRSLRRFYQTKKAVE